MKIIDFSQYESDVHSYLGSDNKQCAYYDGKFYMVKFPTDRTTVNSLQTSVSNNVISEYIGSRIMQSLGIEAQNTLLGKWKDDIVVACEDFRSNGFELHEFSWYMQKVYDKKEIGRFPTYKQLYGTINECSSLQPVKQEAIERYWETIIGDALIGNFDRHKDNFGFITNGETIKPAPVYDCGSCLYPSLSEDKFKFVLSNRAEIDKRIYEFPKIALNRSDDIRKEDKFKYFELIPSDFDKECTNALFRLYDKISMERIYAIVDETPFISNDRKDFYKQMLTYRKELILDKSYEMLKNSRSKTAEKPKPKKAKQIERD